MFRFQMVTAKPRHRVRPRPPEEGVRARIIREATRLFSERGFGGTAVQEIASAVGVTKPAVLHHFPSKELIQDAVLGEILVHWEGTLPRLLMATASEGRFDAVLGEVYRFFVEDPARTRVVLRFMLDRPEEARTLLRERVRPWLGAVASYVRRGRERGVHYADIDEDAYVLLILELVIIASASFTTAKAAMPGGSKSQFERELFRIAHASLFSGGEASHDRPKATKRDPRAAKRKSPSRA